MFQELLAKVANALDLNDIPYMIIDGQAVLLYGEPRLTRDIDITLGINIDEYAKILDIIHKINLVPLPEEPKNFVEKTFVLPVKDIDTNIRVDFIFSNTAYEKQAFKRTNKVMILNTPVKFASLEDVLIHKIFAGRPVDLQDARSIIDKNPEFDDKYVEKWLKEFETSTGKKFLNVFKSIRGTKFG